MSTSRCSHTSALAMPVRYAIAVVVALASSACDTTAPLPPDDFISRVPLFDDVDREISRGHAHNDYEHARPLLDALSFGYTSVEVDVFWRPDSRSGGEGASEIAVAHFPWQYRGELSALYLDPLVALVSARGSVYGDGRPFTLWIDLKDDSDELTDAIHRRLEANAEVFARYVDDSTESGAITVVFTGAAAKARYVQRNERFAVADKNSLVDDGASNARVAYYALSDVDDVDAAVSFAHERARKLRIFGAPDDAESWCAQWRAGVDFIGTDRLADLMTTLDAAECSR